MAKPRRKGMRRAYIKNRFGSEMINGGERINTAMRKEYQQFSFNPSIPLPNRKTLVKHDPATGGSRTNAQFTQPFVEKLAKHNPGHFGLQPKKIEPYTQIWVNAGNYVLKAVFNTLDDNAIYFFIEIDKTLNRVRESMTMSKRTALALRENGLKGIPWKE